MTLLHLNTSPTDDNDIQVLVSGLLMKATSEEGADKPWSFTGVASDEAEDYEGDKILRKSLDLSYAQERGYVNWDHSRQPVDQVGFLTKAVIIPPKQVDSLRGTFPDIKNGASVLVEGQLYKHVPKAQEIHNILKSMPDGYTGLGLSLDGSVAKDPRNGGLVKAYVRGVAFTAQPVQPKTLVKLRKSLSSMSSILEVDGLPTDFAKSVAEHVLEELRKSAKEGLSQEEAVMFVLRQKPEWSYDLASKVVNYTLTQMAKGEG